jgi:hypothetical protein
LRGAIYIPSALLSVFFESFEDLNLPWPMSDEDTIDRILSGKYYFGGKFPSKGKSLLLASCDTGWTRRTFDDPTVSHKQVSTGEEAVCASHEFAVGYWQVCQDLVITGHWGYPRARTRGDVNIAVICPKTPGPLHL